jgi:acyl-CoA-dependent ceramide synthase
MLIPIVLYLNHAALTHYRILPHDAPNPFAPLLLPQGRLSNGKYTKAWADLLFVANYIIFWSL